MTVTSYHKLTVWQKAIDFVVDCYALTGYFPKTELYGLSSQLQRAAVSIPSNIAEGAGRGHTREYIRHLGIARGSLFESETQIIISQRLGYTTPEQIAPLLDLVAEVGRMLYGLIASLERKLDREQG
jgi:four helix bundle protein